MTVTDEELRGVLTYYQRALEGHVYIRNTVDAFMSALGRRIAALPHDPVVLELGSHAGVVTSWLLQRWPQLSVLVCDDDERLVEMSRKHLADPRVTYVSGPLASRAARADLVVSVARHHHLPHDYLSELRASIGPSCIYVLADELCPEYCEGAHAQRIEKSEFLRVVGGHILTTAEERGAFEATGELPAMAVELEDLRRRALWRWYRYVVDVAVERNYFDVAAGELQSTHDDLITGSAAEHKFSPIIVERQFALAGFRMLSKKLVGPQDDPTRQSMFVYEFAAEC